jgi:predicted NAD/FAD-binding protein
LTSIAIIGTGIAGLGAAHLLHSKFDITLFEKNAYIGGHTQTLFVPENDQTIPMDTGFMVYNKVTYPNLVRLFEELQVQTKPTAMSFSVQHLPLNLEYCGSSWNQLFAQRRNLWNPRFIKMLLQINRFNKEAIQSLKNPEIESYSLKQYVDEKKYGEDFLNMYLIPMSSAVWSTPKNKMFEFPAWTLLHFFHNHGFLGMHTQHPWYTVEQGSQSYVKKIIAPFKNKIRLNQRIHRVLRKNSKISMEHKNGQKETYDKVIFACHADQALQLLNDATIEETRLLKPFQYQTNPTLVHTDESVMPKKKRTWASWNYRIDVNQEASTHYWMNKLQGVSKNKNYFVSLNYDKIPPEKIIKKIDYEHPIFTLEAIQTQKELPKLNTLSQNQTTYFCGSYFNYGFHEDALTSALELGKVLCV